ncbi:MAG: 50S ribosomal protein L10 [Candidatus Omnitrophota bacterium]
MIAKDKYGKLCKELMIEEIASRFKERPNFVITSYMGSSVADLESLRRNLKQSSSTFFVVKNSALKIIFEKIKMESEVSKIDSGMGISLSGEDIVATCKILAAFAKDHDKFKIKGAVIDGKPLPPEKVKELAGLPPKNVLLAQVVGGIKSPITGFVNTLSAVLRKFVYVVDAIKTSKQSTPAAGAQEVRT